MKQPKDLIGEVQVKWPTDVVHISTTDMHLDKFGRDAERRRKFVKAAKRGGK